MPIIKQPNENAVAHAMANHHRMATSEWRHKIRIKDLLTDETSHKGVDNLCERAVKEIDAVIKAEDNRRDQKDLKERRYFINELINVKNSFDALIGAENDTIGDRENDFNSVLSELYDLGDTKIELRGGGLQKFIWIA